MRPALVRLAAASLLIFTAVAPAAADVPPEPYEPASPLFWLIFLGIALALAYAMVRRRRK